jgi:mitochondrial-processing peptidase subunit alpha
MSATNYSTKLLSVINNAVAVTTKSRKQLQTTLVTQKVKSHRSFLTTSSTTYCSSLSRNGSKVNKNNPTYHYQNHASQSQQQNPITKRTQSSNSNNGGLEEEPYVSLTYPFATEPPEEIKRTVAKDVMNNAKHRQGPPTVSPPLQRLSNSNFSTNSEDISTSTETTLGSFFNAFSNSSSSSLNSNNSEITTGTTDTTDGNNSTGTGTTLQEQLLDPFDDEQTLTDEEVTAILQEQKNTILTKPANTTPITLSVPANIPPLLPTSLLDIPTTQLTTLDNGIRIVSYNSYGSQVSTIGIVSELGSCTETLSKKNRGVANVLEMLTCNSSTRSYPSGQLINEKLSNLGGSSRGIMVGREYTIIYYDLIRHNIEDAVKLLNEVILHPQFTIDDVNDAIQSLQYSMSDTLPNDILLSEAIPIAAYGQQQQIGQRHFVGGTPELNNLLTSITSQTCNDYWKNQLLNNPSNLVIGGVGVDHNQFVSMIQSLTDFPQLINDTSNRTMIQQSKYIGGDYRCTVPDPSTLLLQQQQEEEMSNDDNNFSMPLQQTAEEQHYVKVALGFEVGGWIKDDDTSTSMNSNRIHRSNDDIVTVCVLQTLLGGGSSFSVGGPGKGMYSRLYRQVLNRYSWAENAEAFTAVYNNNGVFGIAATAKHPNYAYDMVYVLAEHLHRLQTELVTDEELIRAQNMLKNNVLSSLESRLVNFEDMTKQVLMYGERDNLHDTISKIQNVSAHDIQQLINNSINIKSNKRPTFAAVGIDLSTLPSYDHIKDWFA